MCKALFLSQHFFDFKIHFYLQTYIPFQSEIFKKIRYLYSGSKCVYFNFSYLKKLKTTLFDTWVNKSLLIFRDYFWIHKFNFKMNVLLFIIINNTKLKKHNIQLYFRFIYIVGLLKLTVKTNLLNWKEDFSCTFDFIKSPFL